MDQAERLREFLQQKKQPKPTRVIAVTSGKGGVGKSNFSVNLALTLMAQGQKVVIIDLDIGMANIDILMGLSPKSNLLDIIHRNYSIWNVIEKGPFGLEYIAGGSGFQDVLKLEEQGMNQFFQQLERLQGYADFILLDTGAGISQESLRFILAADEVLLVTTPEPTAITDAYSMVKILHGRNPSVQIRLMVNRVQSYQEGRTVAEKIQLVSKKFLQLEIGTLGYLMEDSQVMQAVKNQTPFYVAYPNSAASKGIKEIAQSYLSGAEAVQSDDKGMKGFIQRLVRMVKQ
ncbi:MinD/ParA family protein [Ammoniphilus resinae]|uniref:Flagellar biosynthesis protein FlhG n=1 Tax=Ammoniphilus resinae TaxID=861532 RepID=A0ABS4GKN1_9BACL|nr:MinD/ParA family protein [Ammoniphilus resinae]MBP1930801.1 flagellar biosynthesis protein FlhG [Ammoniphilus resinae]